MRLKILNRTLAKKKTLPRPRTDASCTILYPEPHGYPFFRWFTLRCSTVLMTHGLSDSDLGSPIQKIWRLLLACGEQFGSGANPLSRAILTTRSKNENKCYERNERSTFSYCPSPYSKSKFCTVILDLKMFLGTNALLDYWSRSMVRSALSISFSAVLKLPSM